MLKGLVLGLAVAVAAVAATDTPTVTFSKDVAPILQKNCQGCHRPGEPAPMSLLSYQEARPWAKAMKEALLLKRMPPWFADPHSGKKFANDRSLSQTEIETLVAWADTGAKEGNPKDLPPPRQFIEGWNIGKPDAVFEMP
ncbi:MAG: cytochrome c, partial [Acidobacteria bacterium]|nr:cytochrome c [Acidobacteriota bacterium]